MCRILMITLCTILFLVIAHAVPANQAVAQSATPTPSPFSTGQPDRIVTGDPILPIGATEYLKDVDKKLDASLAATLAGLALAAAAFLATLEQQRRSDLAAQYRFLDASKLMEISTAARKAGNPEPQIEQVVQVNKATNSMVWAFYFFVVVLVSALVLHPTEGLKGELSARVIADLTVAGGGMTAGVARMFWGALWLRRTISPGKLKGETGAD